MTTKEYSNKIKVRCPLCLKSGELMIEKDLIEQSLSGITAINIVENVICEHSFVAYLDKNLAIRDAFVCDFRINLPEINITDIYDENLKIPFDISIVRINILPSILAKIIRSVLMGLKIIYISDQEFLNNHYIKFLHHIFGDNFNIDIVFLSNDLYKKNRKRYKDHVVMHRTKVLEDKNKILEQSKLKIEQAIVQNFYNEYDEVSSIILLKNEIEKIEQFIYQILKFHKTLNENQQFIIKDVIKYLEEIYKTTLPVPYINFLLDIIENYFSINLNRPNRMINFLGLL